VSENQDDPAVSRRQFFRGFAGDLLKVVGEVTGMAAEATQSTPAPLSFSEDEEIIPREQQLATLNDLFGFLERLDVQEKERAAREAAGSDPDADPDAEPEPA
jgi:hypothetical protein